MERIKAEDYINQFEKLITDEALTCDDIKSHIQYLVSETPFSFLQISLPFIVRTSVLGVNEVCNNVSRCSYNPDTNGIPLQRCNYVEQQVFYGSITGGMKNLTDGAQSSFMETCFDRIKEDETFCQRNIVATRWKFKRAPFLWTLPYHPTSKQLNQNFNFLYDEFEKILIQSSHNDLEYSDFKKRVEYLSSLYCRNENKKAVYRITATFHNEVCNLFLKIYNLKLDGLIYPSANTYGEGMNIVLNKDFINQDNIECDYAILCDFHRGETDSMDISFLPIEEVLPSQDGDLNFKFFQR